MSGPIEKNSPNLNMLLRLTSTFTVFIVISFLVLMSAFHGDIKAFVLMVGLMVMYVIIYFIQNTLKMNPFGPVVTGSDILGMSGMRTSGSTLRDSKCDAIGSVMGWEHKYGFPAVSTALMGMIDSYLLVPMMFQPWRGENMGLVIGLSVITSIMAYTRSQWRCEEKRAIGVGLVFGLSFGALYYIFVNSVFPDGVYHGYFSNKAICATKAKSWVCQKRNT